jgi:hypothetical protein
MTTEDAFDLARHSALEAWDQRNAFPFPAVAFATYFANLLDTLRGADLVEREMVTYCASETFHALVRKLVNGEPT